MTVPDTLESFPDRTDLGKSTRDTFRRIPASCIN